MKRQLLLAENKDIFDKIKYRTKFEVSHAVWNPNISLIALGSRDGEVIVKRYLWKTGWKRNFSREFPAKQFDFCVDNSAESRDELLFLCWSPDGQVLLTVFRSGYCYYLDTQTGDTLFVKKMPYSPIYIGWLKFRPKVPHKFPRIGEQSATLISSDNFNFNESASKDYRNVCGAVEHFYRDILHKSLSASFLCVMHSTGTDIFVDVFSCGILLIRRFTIGGCPALTIRQNKFFINEGKLHLLSKELSNDLFDIIQLSDEIGDDHLLVYDQIADCICWMSFCCIYLQKMFLYSANNWRQSSEAFHQRIFAILANCSDSGTSKRTKNLEMCHDLLQILQEEGGEASDLIERFLSSSSAQKELKQAGHFVDQYTILVKGIVQGLQPTIKVMHNSIGLFRSLLVKLTEFNDCRGCDGRPQSLLDSLLRIAKGHPIFEPHEILEKSCVKILDDFENALFLLDKRLLELLKFAELNRRELDNLIRWLMALIYESGDCVGPPIDENIDEKLIGNLLSEVVAQNLGHGAIDECLFDRIVCHLFDESEKDKYFASDRSKEGNGDGNCANLLAVGAQKEAKCNWTLWRHIQKCLWHFQILSSDGINLLVRPPITQSKCLASSSSKKNAANRRIDFETDEDDEDETDENGMSEAEGRDGPRESEKGPISLHSFIFGHTDQTTIEEKMEYG